MQEINSYITNKFSKWHKYGINIFTKDGLSPKLIELRTVLWLNRQFTWFTGFI